MSKKIEPSTDGSICEVPISLVPLFQGQVTDFIIVKRPEGFKNQHDTRLSHSRLDEDPALAFASREEGGRQAGFRLHDRRIIVQDSR